MEEASTLCARVRRGPWLAAALLLLAGMAGAQAWLPAKGEGTGTLILQDGFVRDHFLADGSQQDFGHIRTFILIQDIDYGITDKLAVDVSVPFVLSKYMGASPHKALPGHLFWDNGNYHGNFQDFRVNVRYGLRKGALRVAPFFSFGVPTNEYAYFAHSAPGTQQREYVLGSSVGRGLAPVLPRAYLQAQYAFVIPQATVGVRPYRSRANWEAGYFLTRRLAVRHVGNLQIGHSGFRLLCFAGRSPANCVDDFPLASRTVTDHYWPHHDQIEKISHLNLGGGASFAFTNSWSGFLALTTTTWGTGGHKDSLSETFGLSWSFRTPWARPEVAVKDANDDSARQHPDQSPRHVH